MGEPKGLGDLFGDRLELPEPTPRPCAGGCGVTVVGPAATWCKSCGDREDARDALHRETIQVQDALDSIPTLWRWARFDSPLLVQRVWGLRNLLSTINHGYPWRDGVTIRGPAGRGKTSLAVAILQHWVAPGTPAGSAIVDRMTARFVSARMIPRMPDGVTTAIAPAFAVLDDLGAEGDMPSARAAVADVLAERHAWNLPTVVTTYLDAAGVVARYGDGVARRMFERALVIDLGGK